MKPSSNIQKELLCLSSYFLNNSNYNTENQYINEQMFFYGRLNLNPLLFFYFIILFWLSTIGVRLSHFYFKK